MVARAYFVNLRKGRIRSPGYEAHLSRLLFKALHELEALQVRRSGGSAPLGRLDVNGLVAG
jgi:hypothetical protein